MSTILTPRERQAVEAVAAFQRVHGTWPTIRDVCNLIESNSTANVYRLLQNAVSAGALERNGGHRKLRGFRLPLGDACPTCGQRVPIDPARPADGD